MLPVVSILLGVAIWFDVRQQRIPNALVIAAIITGVSYHIVFIGWGAFGVPLAGLAVGIGLLLPFHLLGGMGAGDVKLMGALGTIIGPMNTLVAVAFTLIAGAAIGAGYLAFAKGRMASLQRYGAMALLLIRTGRPAYLPPAKGEPARQRFPYAFAIALGTLAALYWMEVTQ